MVETTDFRSVEKLGFSFPHLTRNFPFCHQSASLYIEMIRMIDEISNTNTMYIEMA